MRVRIIEVLSTFWGWQLVHEFTSNQEDTKEKALSYARKLKNRAVEEVK